MKLTKKIKFVTIDLCTISGVQRAERLKAGGWRMIRTGMFSALMCNK